MRHLSCAALICSALAMGSRAAVAQTDRDHLDAMLREHAHEKPTASPATEVPPAQEVVGSEVEYGTVEGRAARGYLARPARVASGPQLPGVLLIHEWWGLNDHIRAMARRVAGEGYQVLALDLYGGRAAETPEQARALVGEIMGNPGRAADHIRVGTDYLQERTSRIGVMGWCFGGGWALQAALLQPGRIDAAVMYYGRPVTDPERLQVLRAPLLGLFGGADRGIPVTSVREMEAALRAQGKDVTIQVYEGAGHAFANPSGDSYRAEAAEDAWRRTLAFLARTLRTGN